MSPPVYRSLYYLSQTYGTPVYNRQNVLIGCTTGYSARPNGKRDSIGSIEVATVAGENVWVEGYGSLVMGMGIIMSSVLFCENCEKKI